MVKFGFRYHQKVPAEPEELQSTPQYGIASPIEFPIPSPAPAWTTELLAGFDVSKSQPKVIFKSDILAYYLVLKLKDCFLLNFPFDFLNSY